MIARATEARCLYVRAAGTKQETHVRRVLDKRRTICGLTVISHSFTVPVFGPVCRDCGAHIAMIMLKMEPD